MILMQFEWHKEWKKMLMWFLIVGIVLGMFMYFFPMMQDSAMESIVVDKMNALPSNMLKMFHLEDGKSLLELPGYFAYVFQYIFIAVCIYASMSGGNALIEEETDGTIEFLYSQPLNRSSLFFGKYFARLVLLIMLWLLLWLVTITFGYAVKPDDYHIQTFIEKSSLIFLNEVVVLILFYNLGILISTFIKSAKQVTSFAMALVFGTFMLGILAGLSDKFSWAENLSPIQLATPSKMLNENLHVTEFGVMLGLSVLFLLLGWQIYKRKDYRL